MATSNRWKCLLLISIFIADSSGLPQMKPYEFSYKVNDSLLGVDFGHSESSDGQVVSGQYHVLLPDGQKQTVTYTADTSNGYRANVESYTPTNIASDSTQQGVKHHKSQFNNAEELRNIIEKLTDEQDTDRSRLLFECSAEVKNRFSECLARCNDLISCELQELKNLHFACFSSITQTCTAIPPPPKVVKCGIEKKVPKRIVNGVDVNIAGKYSWHVGLKAEGLYDGKYFCGGSIITNKHILTAAHCVCDEEPKNVYVGIADHNQNDQTDNLPDFVKPIRAKRFIVHENYDANILLNDIALIELSKPIDLLKHSEDIHPMCLPKDDSKTYAGLTATVTGWGGLVGYNPPDEPPQAVPNVLQETQLPIMKNSRCSNQLGDSIPDTMICAEIKEGFETGGSGDCQGDSGGPLFVKENMQHIQIGIVSFGSGCASKGNPSVYTRVSKFLSWIKMQIGSENIYTAT